MIPRRSPQRTVDDRTRPWSAVLAAVGILAGLLASNLAASSEAAAQGAPRAQALITQSVDENNLVALGGNTRPEVRNPANDRGRIADAVAMPHLLLLLRRSAAQEQALEALIAEQQDPHSPNYHRWLSAEDIGAQFGPAPTDIAAVTTWLQRHGFAVNGVYPNGLVIDFSGTAGQVSAAFHTEIHNVAAHGITRFANMSNPRIPAALAPAVVGVAALHNVPPRHYHKPKSQYTAGGGNYLVTPSDLATIYNFNQIYAAGDTGQGQTIYLLEDTDLFSNSDWSRFRSTFGLSGFAGSLSTVHPPPPFVGASNCIDPGVNSDDDEAILDAEWASAAAPSAAIVMASCTNILTGIQNLVNSAHPPTIMSISYGECEAFNGSAANAAFNSAYQQGVAEGMSIFVSSGDNDAAVCDDRDTAVAASDGIAVNGWASTPYNVAVGGTDFSDTYFGTNSTYWNATNTATYGSARSYIHEIPWNDSCASQLIAQYVTGSSVTYGASGFCNSSTAQSDGLLNIVGASGGPSAVYAKPSWQSGLVGNPADGVRDLPDVSLFAANGIWGHYYVFCFSDTSNGGTGCSGVPSTWNGAGGTSFSAPIFAGIQALINQYTGAAQGNPNPIYYQIAKSQYGAGGNSNCSSDNTSPVGGSCTFHDVTLGDNDADCTSGSPNCYLPSGTYGVLSTSTDSYAPAYKAQVGWDFTTGIGTVNVYSLVTNWAAAGGNSTLVVSVSGGGTVTSSPAGINCTTTCTATFSSSPQVTLTATPTSGWIFNGWGGACSGTGSCLVSANVAQSVSATFVQNFTLSVSETGSGAVTSSPSGINCGATCSASFTSATIVTLTATPSGGTLFGGWGGACSGTGSCNVTMSSAQSVSATFTQATYTLSVNVSGNGAVTSSPAGISCPSTCSAIFNAGTQVTLTATPGGGEIFGGWSGACTGSGGCTVAMNSATGVSASFGTSEPVSDRTWVSATTGSDANPCTREAPCLTFAAAFAMTSAGGEINVLDTGDFGPVTITNAVTLRADVGAGILVSNNSSIIVQAGATDQVVLEGLDIEGLGSGLDGVKVLSAGSVYVLNCRIHHFTGNGVNMNSNVASSRVFIEDSIITQNATGVAVQGNGVINGGVIVNSLVDSNTTNALLVNGAGNVATATQSFLTASPNGINLMNGGSAISIGQQNVVTGAGAFSSNVAYK
jgi:Pro-kumamolisin, activation domain/Divergent InlB B-repeat domain